MSTPIHVEPPDDGFPDELREILDEELARLPARHRGPVVLCELEGLSRPEAARRLGIPEGTLSSRLSRAKARLRDRLASSRRLAARRRPLGHPVPRGAGRDRAPLLLESTVEAATFVAAGPSAAVVLSTSVASLSEGVIKTMLVAKLKGIALAAGTMTAVVSAPWCWHSPGPDARPMPTVPTGRDHGGGPTRSGRSGRRAGEEARPRPRRARTALAVSVALRVTGRIWRRRSRSGQSTTASRGT